MIEPEGRWEPDTDEPGGWVGPESTVTDPDGLRDLPGPFRLIGFNTREVTSCARVSTDQ